MNIAFFLTPKSEVAYEYTDATMRQVIERMEHHGYTAIPLIDKTGKYVGTLTEGDLLWTLKRNPEINFKNTNTVSVKEIPRRVKHKSIIHITITYTFILLKSKLININIPAYTTAIFTFSPNTLKLFKIYWISHFNILHYILPS